MGLKYKTYLESSKVYGCKRCKTHLTSLESLISRVRQRSCVALSLTEFRRSSTANMDVLSCSITW